MSGGTTGIDEHWTDTPNCPLCEGYVSEENLKDLQEWMREVTEMRSKVVQWISVRDRMPRRSSKIRLLVVLEDADGDAWMDVETWYFNRWEHLPPDTNWDDHHKCMITHWAMFPDLPRTLYGIDKSENLRGSSADGIEAATGASSDGGQAGEIKEEN